MPVLYNAGVAKDVMLDPWGKPYEFMIVEAGDSVKKSDEVGKGLNTFMYLPNLYWHRGE